MQPKGPRTRVVYMSPQGKTFNQSKARELAAQGAPINYTVFAGGNHRYTWSFAYNIPFILDWMFAQHG